MITGKTIWKPLVQKMVTGQANRFRMTRRLPQWPGRLTAPGLYLHVPFCKNLCPYCPYNRIEYDDDLFIAYERAVKHEIDLYAPHLDGQAFGSLYIGGGTPTVNWRGLVSIVRHLQDRFHDIGDICVELHPGNMDGDCLSALSAYSADSATRFRRNPPPSSDPSRQGVPIDSATPVRSVATLVFSSFS